MVRARPIIALAAAILLVGLAVGCARDDVILTVNGWQLSRAAFADELDQIATNKGYLGARSLAGQSFRVFKDGSTTDYADAFVAEFLNERITFQLAQAEVAKRGLTVTDEDRARATDVIVSGLATGSSPDAAPPAPTDSGGPTGTIAPGATRSEPTSKPTDPGATGSTGSTGSTAPGPAAVAGRAVLDGFGSYRDVLVTGVASLQVVRRALVADVTNDDQLRGLYEQVKDRYANQSCASHVLARAGSGADALDPQTGDRVLPSEEDYAAALARIEIAKAQIDGGADFATVAREQSDDEQSKGQGGVIGCAPKGQYEGPFEDAVWAQPVGQVGAPVRTARGYHLILVTDRRVRTFDEIKGDLRAGVESQGQQAMDEWLRRESASAAVIIDPVLGHWNPATGLIEPPGGAAPLTLVPDSGTSAPPNGSTVPVAPPVSPPDSTP